MFDRHSGGEKALLVHINFPHEKNLQDKQEFIELSLSAGLEICEIIGGSRSSPHAGYFIGTGKVEEVAQSVKVHDAEVVIFNHQLSPAQERNLEKLLQCRVIDRTGLILDIFAQRAQSHEGQLQVELAQLNHLSTRLIRGWTHLERQKGGIGLRGPGETQLETDRRLLRERIKTIGKRLEKVTRQREQSRRSRRRSNMPIIALVGYTNAGKSSLFNRLTASQVYAADQLFATLDPTHRKIQLPGGQNAILSDTVGFIRHLPHDLVAAFKATLQESREADILLHVIDAADERKQENIQQVYQVLQAIGAAEVKTIEVYNKIDRLQQVTTKVEPSLDGSPTRIWCSAKSGEGMDLLKHTIIQQLEIEWQHLKLKLSPQEMKIRSELFALDVIKQEQIQQDGSIILDISISQADWQSLIKKTQGQIAAARIETYN